MGGDHAPHATLTGAQEALAEIEGELVLVGDEKVIHPLLAKRRFRALQAALSEGSQRTGCQVRLVHAAEAIDMADSIRAVRSKPGASINVGCRLAAQSWAEYRANPSALAGPAAFITAGHSGALMASALMHMGRLP